MKKQECETLALELGDRVAWASLRAKSVFCWWPIMDASGIMEQTGLSFSLVNAFPRPWGTWTGEVYSPAFETLARGSRIV